MDLSSWIPAVWTAFHARALSRSARDVLLTLRTFRGAGGLIYPSHARLAERVGCCVSTVQVALAAARDAGLVGWTSGRRRRTSNRYTLELPEGTPSARVPRRQERAAARAVRPLVGERRGGGENSFKKGLIGMPHPPVHTPAQQIAALMRPTSEAGRREARESLATMAARRAAERDAAWMATRTAQAAHWGRRGGMATAVG